VPRYNELLGLKPGTRLDDPALVAALARLAELEQRGFLNQGVSGVGTDEARSLLAQGKAAMLPIGDWLVSEAEEATVADLDAFRLPRLPGQRGDDTTLLALTTGYMMNRTTRHPAEAKALLRALTSDAVQQEWVRRGHMSPLRAAAPGPDAPRGQRRLLQFLQEARASALAPDVGFNLEVSDAFLDAASLVLGGRATPTEALAGAERQVRALRQPAGLAGAGR
jgi:ABC-type glycerol-3-phosphate transport system substrate-binding protein